MYMLHLNSTWSGKNLASKRETQNPLMANGENTLNQSTEINMI